MKIQACVVVLLSLAWSVMAIQSLGVEHQGNHGKAAPTHTNILEAFKKSDSQKTPGEFDSFSLESRKARLKVPYQLQKTEGNRIQANLLKLQDETNFVKTHDPRQPQMLNVVIVRNVDMQADQLLATNEDLLSIGDEQFLPLGANKAPELTANIDNIKNCAFEGRNIPCRCILELDEGSGNIRGFRWYYNPSLGRCERFQYGGHGGNDNNFKTVRECKDTCEVPAIPAICLLELGPGWGNFDEIRWFYSSERKRCEKFQYGGTGGNQNKFKSLVDCKQTCEVANSYNGSRFYPDY